MLSKNRKWLIKYAEKNKYYRNGEQNPGSPLYPGKYRKPLTLSPGWGRWWNHVIPEGYFPFRDNWIEETFQFFLEKGAVLKVSSWNLQIITQIVLFINESWWNGDFPLYMPVNRDNISNFGWRNHWFEFRCLLWYKKGTDYGGNSVKNNGKNVQQHTITGWPSLYFLITDGSHVSDWMESKY